MVTAKPDEYRYCGEDRNFNPLGRSRGVASPPIWSKLGTETSRIVLKI